MASPASSQASGSVAQRARPAKSGPFTAFEDAMLLDLVAKHGDRWSLVAHGMAGRGIDQCKLRHEELRLRALATQAIPAPGRPPAKKKHGKKSDENAPVPVPVAIPTSIPLPAITMPARPAPAPVVVPVGPLTVGASMRREKDAKLPRLLPKPDGMTTRRQAEAVPLPVAAPLAPQREVLGERINAPDDRSSTHSSPGAAVPAHRPCASATVIARERNQAASSGQKRDQQNTAPGSQSQQPSRSQQRMTLASLMTKTQPSPMSSIPPMRIGMPGRPAMPSPGPGTPTTPQPDTPVFQTFHDQHLLSAARASFDEHLQSAKRGSSRRRLAAPRPKTTTTRRTQSAAVPAGDESTYAGSVVDGFGGSQLHYDAMSIGEQGSDYDFGADMGLYSQADLSSAADWNDDLLSSILGVDYAPPSADFGSMNDDIFGMDSPFSPERNFEVDSIFSQPPLMPMPVAPEPITARKRTVPPLPPLTIPRANPSAAGSLSTQQRPPPLSADQDPNAAVIEELLSGIIGDGSDAGFFAEEPVPFSEQSEPEYRADDVPLDEELELLVDAANPTSEPITVDAVLPTDAPIYSRTRQRLSLENFDLQTLESESWRVLCRPSVRCLIASSSSSPFQDMLPYSILESLQMDADQVRYSSFVKSLHQQHLATDGAAMSPFPHDEDDGEFRATEVDEEDLEYAVPHEEIESLLKENEAFDALGSERMDGMAWAGNNGQRVFTEQQIATLRMQMAQSFQIAAQAYALQAALHGTKSKEAGVWKHQLVCCCGDRHPSAGRGH